jgi:hypothetical protein
MNISKNRRTEKLEISTKARAIVEIRSWSYFHDFESLKIRRSLKALKAETGPFPELVEFSGNELLTTTSIMLKITTTASKMLNLSFIYSFGPIPIFLIIISMKNTPKKTILRTSKYYYSS